MIHFSLSIQSKFEPTCYNMHYLLVHVGMFMHFCAFFDLPKDDAHIFGMHQFAMEAWHDFLGRYCGEVEVHVADFTCEDNKKSAVFPFNSGQEQSLSLIHISEPTRRTPISYAVFC